MSRIHFIETCWRTCLKYYRSRFSSRPLRIVEGTSSLHWCLLSTRPRPPEHELSYPSMIWQALILAIEWNSCLEGTQPHLHWVFGWASLAVKDSMQFNLHWRILKFLTRSHGPGDMRVTYVTFGWRLDRRPDWVGNRTWSWTSTICMRRIRSCLACTLGLCKASL